jgi:hypothetical protein
MAAKTHNAEVGGSIPPLATIFFYYLRGVFLLPGIAGPGLEVLDRLPDIIQHRLLIK